MKRGQLILSCEHGGNTIPAAYQHLFHDASEVLASHRGWDPGALQIARTVASRLRAPLFASETSRLLVEPNRSLNSRALFSSYTSVLDDREKESILNRYYFPHRLAVEEAVKRAGDALHLSVHTFTPVLDGVERRLDVGLLFDPDRPAEAVFCDRFRDRLQLSLPEMTIVFNQPYLGIDDGLTTHLRSKFPDPAYAGIEIEINQLHSSTGTSLQVAEAIGSALRHLGY